MAAANRFQAGTVLAKRMPQVENYQRGIVIPRLEPSLESGMSINGLPVYNLARVIFLMKAL